MPNPLVPTTVAEMLDKIFGIKSGPAPLAK